MQKFESYCVISAENLRNNKYVPFSVFSGSFSLAVIFIFRRKGFPLEDIEN